MRPWLVLFWCAPLVCACPLEPLTGTGFGVSSQIKAASVGAATMAVSVPGLKAKDAAGLTALINGVPVPIVSTADGEVTLRLPPGQRADTARFELWRSGERIVNRDIAAQIAQGVGLSPHDAVRTGDTPAGSTLAGNTTVNTFSSSLPGGINITINVPAGSATSGGTGSGVTVTGATPTPTATATATATPTPTGGGTATPVATPTPNPTPTPVPTPTPSPTMVPVVDQTPVPPGTGEVTGNVAF